MQNDLQPWAHYAGDGSTVTYAYPFRILSAQHLQVFVDGVQRFDLTITGVGVASGGNVTLHSPPPVGDVVFIRRNTIRTQDVDYVEGGFVTADALENALDRLAQMIQDAREELARRPALPVESLQAVRGLFFPTPAPLKLWGWNASADQVVYYNPAIVQVTPGLSSHLAFAETSIVVPTVSGEVQLTGTLAFPAGSIRVGMLLRVSTTFGDSLGLSTISVGDGLTVDRWGAGLARTATAAPVGANNPGAWRGFELSPVPSNEDVVITAETGLFDATGAAVVTASYFTLVAG